MGMDLARHIDTSRPGFLSPSAGLKFADIPNGLAAVSKVPVAGWAQIAAYFGFVEFSGGFEDYKTGTPGDYGFKVLTSSDPEEKTKKLSAELANGRLAMMAIIGMFFQDLVPMQQRWFLTKMVETVGWHWQLRMLSQSESTIFVRTLKELFQLLNTFFFNAGLNHTSSLIQDDHKSTTSSSLNAFSHLIPISWMSTYTSIYSCDISRSRVRWVA